MHKHALISGALLLLAGCAGTESTVGPASSEAPALTIQADHTILTEAVSVVVPNFCTGEPVILTGRIHVNLRTAETNSDGFRSVSHISFDLWGYGQNTGDLYHLKEHNSVVSRLRDEGNGQTFTQILRTTLQRKGQATDVGFMLQVHFIEQADGTRSVDRTETWFEC